MRGVELFDHQKKAIDKMRNGCILYGDVGSGKSRTALAYYFVQNGGVLKPLKLMPKPQDLYIITTARKRDLLEWEGELAPFRISVHQDVSGHANKHKVVVDSWNNIKKYVDVEGAFFIFDEQRVVGSGAWVKAFIKITKKNHWILLSATPGDTWMDYIPVFIANGFYKNRTQFIREHVVYNRAVKFPLIDRYLDTGKLLYFRNKILVPLEYRHETKTNHVDVEVGFDSVKYKYVVKNRWDIWKEEPFLNGGGLCYGMRRVVNEDPSRGEAVLELLKKHPKVIIFYNFDYELEALRTLKYPKGTVVAEWNGHKHEDVPKGDKWVYLVQYTAGAEGWNCITTDTMIFYSQTYSYKTWKQACGRTNRLNTPFKELYYYHLKSKSGIDRAIAASRKKKKNFNASAFAKW